MKNPFYLCFYLLLATLPVFSQSNERFTVKGIVSDSLGEKLPFATVMLLNPKDSALINYGRSNDDGLLEFKNLRRAHYLLKINYVGYLPHQQDIHPADGPLTDLGTIQLKVLNKDLMEVVIKTARAPLSIRGDTVEYNAASFKVPPGATVEDLLRRLPGMEVDQEGNIKAQGQQVQRVTVDGKRFFGDDPKQATRNLNAEAISKVQVYNSQTEQARLTGVDDGKQEKTVNLELKDSHKKGGFGKATAGVGTDHRLQAKVNYNRFDDKNQLAVIGMANNVNQTGISRDDYQDFRGSQSFNWGNEGDFGFGGGWEGSNDIEVDWGGNRDRGFSKNWAGGVNYNYETKKTKFSTYYYYNQTKQTLDGLTAKENFLNDLTYQTVDKNSALNTSGNHRTSIRFEKELDSLNTFVVQNQIRIGNGDNRYNSNQLFYRGTDVPGTTSELLNQNRYTSFQINTQALYNHKFRKKGRSFALSAAYTINNSDNNGDQYAENLFHGAGIGGLDSLYILNQRNDTRSLYNRFKAGTQYVEPLSTRFFLESFYNFSVSNNEVDREVFDRSEIAEQLNPYLSRFYTNRFFSNRGGARLRYRHQGFNLAVGLAAQQFDLQGKFHAETANSLPMLINKHYFGWIPNVSLNFQMKNNRYLYAGYSPYMSLPSITDLQPVVDNSNPLYIREGNPDLLPATNHNANVGFNYFNPGSFISFYLGTGFNFQTNQVVYAQTVDENLVTRTRPENITGGKGYNVYAYFTMPIVKTKLTLRTNFGYQHSLYMTRINGLKNTTNTNGYPVGVGLDITPNEFLTFYPSARWNINHTKYSINTTQNQRIVNTTYSGEMNLKLPRDIYFNGALNYNIFDNPRQGFYLDQPILNLALYHLLLKNKRAEIRLTAFDVFNKNQGIRVYTSQNFATHEQIQTLGRYFMLSFTYNMRGVTANMRRQGGMF